MNDHSNDLGSDAAETTRPVDPAWLQSVRRQTTTERSADDTAGEGADTAATTEMVATDATAGDAAAVPEMADSAAAAERTMPARDVLEQVRAAHRRTSPAPSPPPSPLPSAFTEPTAEIPAAPLPPPTGGPPPVAPTEPLRRVASPANAGQPRRWTPPARIKPADVPSAAPLIVEAQRPKDRRWLYAAFAVVAAALVAGVVLLTRGGDDEESPNSTVAESVSPTDQPGTTSPPPTAAPSTTVAPVTAAPSTTAAPETTVVETAPLETAAPETAAPETAAPETAVPEPGPEPAPDPPTTVAGAAP